jgi:hypothetical protein
LLTDLSGTGEGHLVDARVGDKGRAGTPSSSDDVDDPGGELGLLEDFGEQQRRQRGGLGWL